MKLGPVTNLNKRNITMSKKIDNGVMSTSFDIVFIFLIYDQFGAIGKPDSGRMVYKTNIFINGNVFS